MPSYSPSSSAMRSGLDSQLSFMTELTRRTYDSMRKLSELNLQFAQQLLQDSAAATRQMLSCTDPFQFAAVAASAAQPAAEHLRGYQQQLVALVSGVQVELTRSAETFMPEQGRYAAAMAESMARSAGVKVDAGPRGNGASDTRPPNA